MIQRLIFIATMALVALMLVKALYVKLSTPNELPDFEMETTSPAKDEAKTNTDTAPLPPIEQAKKHMTDGLFSLKNKDYSTAEENFTKGLVLAKETQNSRIINNFIIMLTNVYVEQEDYVKARALLNVTKDQGDLDELSYYSQLVYLHERQKNKAELCLALDELDKQLSALECDAHAEDIAVLMERKDRERIMQILEQPNAEKIADCVGKQVVIIKRNAAQCKQ